MRIGLLPSTQNSSTGNGIGTSVESTLCQDITKRLQPKLILAGHVAQIFAGQQDANSDGARALVAWKPQIAVSLHLDASDGGGHGALLCYQEERSKALGMQILSIYCTAMNYKNRGAMKRVPGTNGVAVIRIPEESGIPCALIEMGSMDKPDGPLWLDPEHREKAAECMSRAICSVAGEAIPQPKRKEEDEGMYEQQLNTKEFVRLDCWRDRFDYYVTTDGNAKNLRFKLDGKQGGSGTTDPQDKDGLVDHNIQDILKQDRMKGVQGSYKLIVTSDKDINIGLREVAK